MTMGEVHTLAIRRVENGWVIVPAGGVNQRYDPGHAYGPLAYAQDWNVATRPDELAEFIWTWAFASEDAAAWAQAQASKAEDAAG